MYCKLFVYKEQIKDNKQYYIFLDEVQNVPEFQKAVDGLHLIKNVDLYPYALKLDDEQEIDKYLDALYNTIILKDVAQRKKISDTSMLRTVAKLRRGYKVYINDHYPKYILTMDIDPIADFDGIKKMNVLDWLTQK